MGEKRWEGGNPIWQQETPSEAPYQEYGAHETCVASRGISGTLVSRP